MSVPKGTLFGQTYCRATFSLNCPSGCYNSKSCSDGSSGLSATPTVYAGCSSACASNGLRECVSPDHFRTCALSGKCLAWFNPQKCADGLVCSNGQCVSPPSVSYPICMVDGSVCHAGAQLFNGGVVGCSDMLPCSNGCVNGVCTVVVPRCSASVKCISDYQYELTASDCSTKDVACADGLECKSGKCVVIPPVLVSNSCDGITCPSYCSKDYTKFDGGSCVDGVCKYSTVDTLSDGCIPAVTNMTGTVANPVKDVPIVVDNVVSENFLSRYGLWIAGGVFILALVLFIVTFTPKKRRKRYL